MNIKTELAPKGIEFKASNFIMSDKYCTILTIISYPRLIGEGYLSSLTSMPGIKLVIKHIPVPFSSLQKMINKLSDICFSLVANKTRRVLIVNLILRERN